MIIPVLNSTQEAVYNHCASIIQAHSASSDWEIVCRHLIIHGIDDVQLLEKLITTNANNLNLFGNGAVFAVPEAKKPLFSTFSWPASITPSISRYTVSKSSLIQLYAFSKYVIGQQVPRTSATERLTNQTLDLSPYPFIVEFIKLLTQEGITNDIINSVDCCLYDYTFLDRLKSSIGNLTDTTGNKTEIAKLVNIFKQIKDNNSLFDTTIAQAIDTALANIATTPVQPQTAEPQTTVHQAQQSLPQQQTQIIQPQPSAQQQQPDNQSQIPDDNNDTEQNDATTALTVDSTVANCVTALAVSRSQVSEAMQYIESIINAHPNSNPMVPFLTNYVKGISERAVIQILDNYTTDGAHKVNYGQNKVNPHSNLVGSNYYTSSKGEQHINPVQLPRGFKHNDTIIRWDKPIITNFGFPFVNFTSTEISAILHSHDEEAVKKAYKKVKKLLKKTGISSPIKLLQNFAHANGELCTLNTLTVDSSALNDAAINSKISVRAVDDYSSGVKFIGGCSVGYAFLSTFYTIMPPVEASAEYCTYCGMDEAEYAKYLNENGMPPIYILTPKPGATFAASPAGGFLHNLFSSKTKPILVQAKIDNHIGGFVIPEKDTEKLFHR